MYKMQKSVHEFVFIAIYMPAWSQSAKMTQQKHLIHKRRVDISDRRMQMRM